MQAAATPLEISSLYGRHGDWLRLWLKRRTRCPERAADLAQDTFCRILERQEVADLRNPRAYLATVARRILIDDVRRREVEQAYLDAYALLHSDSEALSPERIAEAANLLGAIMQVLEGLSEKARRSFLMIRFDGLRYADAAAILGISERMVKRYVAQAYTHCYAIAYAG